MLGQMQNIRLVMLWYVLIFSIFAKGYVGVNAEHSAGDAMVSFDLCHLC